MNKQDLSSLANIKRKTTRANMDDTSTYWTLNGEGKSEGNIKRQ